MATAIPKLALTPDLRSLLAGLRWRIRLYIWLEGLALAVIWVGLMFWVGLALDYLPVLLGASEMPAVARGVLLAATGVMLAYILYRWIGRRTFVRLSDRSMALLLERRYSGFHDSLVTAVEMSGAPDHASAFSRDLLGLTTKEARAEVGHVRYRQVFNNGSLAWKVLLAAVVAGSVALFFSTNAAAAGRATERLLLLSNEPWPRSAKIEVTGIEVLREAAPGEDSPRTITLPFVNRMVKVAKGANVSLKVRAAQAPEAQVVPQHCTIYYRTRTSGEGIRGERGSVTMSNFRDVISAGGSGSSRNFWFDGKPFKGVLSTVEFDVVGFDHRVGGYKLEVVDSPAVVETLLDLEFPKYMVDEAISSRLPASDQPYLPAGTFIPTGTRVTLKFRSNKELLQAEIAVEGTDQRTVIDISPTAADRFRFSHRIDALPGSQTLSISLIDHDNVTTERPFRVFLTAIEDQPPQVEVSLKGIGSSVTPDVTVPFRGKVSDDYAVAKSWFEVRVNESGDPHDVAVAIGKAGAVDQEIDFRRARTDKTGLEIKPGDKLFLAVKAADKFDLPDSSGQPGQPHEASGERYQLDVVTPEQLLAQLEVREVGLRRRFEQIIDELTQMRDSLLRVKASVSPGAAAADPEDLRSDDDPEGKQLSPEQKAQRAADFRLLRVQRAIQQSQKSVAEVAGVAAGFLDIREELINNRVDTEDRKKRLKDLIADPLNTTCAEEFPKLDQQMQVLETKLREAGVKLVPAEASPLADSAIDQANAVLAKLEEVLARMQDLETYNELLEIVRDLLKDQQKLSERTDQERKRQIRDELK
ncbi:MAG TPA: hypothetical protein VFB80_12590 [Pirellulaceae bacterium]|nr:hypothetical protein [Pirellulaceae bacterium]